MRVVLRADATPRGGIGHVVRAHALGQALTVAGHSVTLATRIVPEGIGARLKQDGISIHSLAGETDVTDHPAQRAADARTIRALEPDWLVLDGYDLGVEGEEWRAAADRLLVIDDPGWSHASSSAVVNGNLYASLAMYPGVRDGTELLLGPGYAPLRMEFTRARGQSLVSERSIRRRIVITFGGSDPGNLTLRATQALMEMDSRPELQVVVGPSHPDPASIEAAAASAPSTVVVVRDPSSMVAVLRDADLVVGGGGTSLLECAALGVPVIAMAVADNQRAGAEAMERLGLGIDLGEGLAADARTLQEAVRGLLDDPARRREMSSRGRDVVDGRGAGRAVQYLERPDLELRPATGADAELLYQWANDPTVRAASFHGDVIEWDAHQAWLTAQLGDPDAWITIAECGGAAVGSVRFAVDGGTVTISITVSPDHRSRGLGARMIALASRHALGRPGIDRIHGWIRTDNARSRKAFALAGYAREPGTRTTPGGVPADLYVIGRTSGG